MPNSARAQLSRRTFQLLGLGAGMNLLGGSKAYAGAGDPGPMTPTQSPWVLGVRNPGPPRAIIVFDTPAPLTVREKGGTHRAITFYSLDMARGPKFTLWEGLDGYVGGEIAYKARTEVNSDMDFKVWFNEDTSTQPLLLSAIAPAMTDQGCLNPTTDPKNTVAAYTEQFVQLTQSGRVTETAAQLFYRIKFAYLEIHGLADDCQPR